MTHKLARVKHLRKPLYTTLNFPPDKRHPGHRSSNGKYGPLSRYGFLPTACQPIRKDKFEKPYNKALISSNV